MAYIDNLAGVTGLFAQLTVFLKDAGLEGTKDKDETRAMNRVSPVVTGCAHESS